MPLQLSALYQKASKAALASATREFRRSDFGKLHREVNRTVRQPKRYQRRFEKLAREARRVTKAGKVSNARVPTPKKMIRGLIGVDPTHLVAEVRKYGQGTGLASSLVSEFLSSLGPAGKIIKALASGTQEQPDLESMADVLRAAGYTVLPPEEAPGMVSEAMPRSARGRAADEARRREVQAPRRGKAPIRKPVPKTIELPLSNGKYQRFDKSHPIVTGEMVKATASTNVHSFAYKIDAWTLFVRFWSGAQRSRHAGPMYAYYQVEPEEFLRMYRVRGSGDKHLPGVKSPGTFVWEKLRIQGTVSGHQYDYKLVGVARGYVPRKATYTPEGEIFKQRTFKTQGGDILRSSLPSDLVNRGSPNKGSPNTGRS